MYLFIVLHLRISFSSYKTTINSNHYYAKFQCFRFFLICFSYQIQDLKILKENTLEILFFKIMINVFFYFLKLYTYFFVDNHMCFLIQVFHQITQFQ